MSQKTFDKRIRFVFTTAKTGHGDPMLINDWYCSLSKKDRDTTPNPVLLERFIAWLPIKEVQA